MSALEKHETEVIDVNVAVILAGGRGSRFGGELPKQFVEVRGKPVLAYTLEAFGRAPEIDAIEVVCQPEHDDRVREIARRCGIEKPLVLAPGGESCPESIRSGFFALREALSEEDIVLLHMGVSPLVTQSDIAGALAVCRERGCCFTMHPVTICMARAGGEGWADEDAPKERYIELNTPWAFRYGAVLSLYEALERRGHRLSETDYTLSLWLADGRRAWYRRGSDRGRLKITTPHDLDVFEGLLRVEEGRK